MAQNSHKKTSVQRMARSTRRIGYLVSFGALLFGFGFLAWRLYDIQVINGDYWRGLASVQQLKDTTLQAVRGEIYDSTGKTLASTSIVWDVSCDPKNSKGLYTTVAETGESYLNEAICSEVCAGIARILVANDGTRGEAVDVKSPEYLEQYQYLYERFSRITSQYRLLAGRVDMPVANAIDAYVDEFNKAHTTKERTVALIVSITKTYKRDYPYGAFAAAVLGFCDDSGAGVYGLEKSYNEQL
ncbi:MAG: peptidase, partial [Faecalibacterium sp.]|nr:peptidase [Faecalibacterium sp.]